MLMLGTIAHAQVDEVAILIKAAKIMNQRGYNKTHYFRAKAKEKLREQGRYFDRGRVEVTGFVSADATAMDSCLEQHSTRGREAPAGCERRRQLRLKNSSGGSAPAARSWS